MSEIVIRAHNLGKRYRLGQLEPYQMLRDAISNAVKAAFRSSSTSVSNPSSERNPGNDEYIWALRNVSFEIRQGEAVGIIGRNGAGKTTLLRILSRITEPTEGVAEIRGRVGSLLEVGTGFHPELTGRENIYLNGAVLGMKKAEIDRKFDEIVAFSELEKFLDTPVKRYSSGMYVRLAFAVAAHLEPEILLVDEVLAVGDIAFQRKCLGKMEDVAQEGRTVLFVSHNMAAIQALTRTAVCIEGGRIIAFGNTENVIRRYISFVNASTPAGSADLSKRRAKVLSSIEVLQEGKPVSAIKMGTPITFRITLSAERPIRRPSLGIGIDSEQNVRIVSFSTLYDLPNLPALVGKRTLFCEAGVLPLNQGEFYVKAVLTEGQEDVDSIEQACKFEVVADDIFKTGHVPTTQQGLVYWPGKWRLEDTRGENPTQTRS